MSESKIKIKVDEFFAMNPHRAFCVLVDAEPDPGVDTFIVVTQALDVVAFDRAIGSWKCFRRDLSGLAEWD